MIDSRISSVVINASVLNQGRQDFSLLLSAARLSPKSRQPGQCLPFGHETSRPGIGVVAVLAMNQGIC